MSIKQNVEDRHLTDKSTGDETSDNYARVLARLDIRHRVIVCKGNQQWIVQRRENTPGEWPWRSLRYRRNRDALIEAYRAFCERVDPNAMAILAASSASLGGVT